MGAEAFLDCALEDLALSDRMIHLSNLFRISSVQTAYVLQTDDREQEKFQHVLQISWSSQLGIILLQDLPALRGQRLFCLDDIFKLWKKSN